MTTGHRKSEDLSRNPGMTPIDNPEPDLSDETHEPDEGTGRLPSQDSDRTTDSATENRRPGGSNGAERDNNGKTRHR